MWVLVALEYACALQAITWRPVQLSSLRHVSNRSTRAMRPVQATTIGKGEFPVAEPEKQKRMHEVRQQPSGLCNDWL